MRSLQEQRITQSEIVKKTVIQDTSFSIAHNTSTLKTEFVRRNAISCPLNALCVLCAPTVNNFQKCSQNVC